jgi:hypothetical protein
MTTTTPEPLPTPAPVVEEVDPVRSSLRERVSSRPLVTAGVAALVAFCVAGVGGFALGHAAGDDGPRDSIARFDDGGMRGQDGHGGFERGPRGDRSEQGPNAQDGDRSEQRPGQGSTESPESDGPTTPQQGGAAAEL